jgi:D-galacturonate reductase
VKVLIVGAGMYVTGRHGTGEGTILAAVAQIARDIDLEVVDVIARSPDNAGVVADAVGRINRRIGSTLHARYYPVSSVMEHLGRHPGYDVAIVSVPDDLHYEVGKAILERKIHCLMVKPLTPKVAEARDLIRIQREGGVYAAVEFHKRFDESNRLVRRMITDGTIGEPRYFVINYSQRISIPLEVFREWSTRSDIFQYLGVHYVDLVYFLTGAHPQRAMAVGTRGVLTASGVQTYDSIHATIQWMRRGGGGEPFVTVMNIGWIDPRCSSALSDQRFTLVGSAGRMEVEQKNRGIELAKDGLGVQHVNPYFADYLPTTGGGMEFQGYGYKSVRCFFDDVHALRAGRVSLDALDGSRPSFRQGLVSTAVVEAVNASLSQSSRWVDIDDPA